MAMNSRRYLKQMFLFLVTVILPSLVLVIFTLRMIDQERELVQKRTADEHRYKAQEIGQRLRVRLEKIKLQEMKALVDRIRFPGKFDYVNPEVVLLSEVKGNNFLLPWEVLQQHLESKRLLTAADFAEKIQRAEKLEFTDNNIALAADLYHRLMQMVSEPVQKNYARLLLARALSKLKKKKEAVAHYYQILALSFEITDEYGIPLSLYAGRRLLDMETDYAGIHSKIRSGIEEKRWLPPAASHLLREIIEDICIDVSEPSIRDDLEDLSKLIQQYFTIQERAQSLQKDFRSLFSQTGRGEETEVWIPFGEVPWFVSLADSPTGNDRILIAVDGNEILASLSSEKDFSNTFPEEPKFITGISSEGDALGSNFPGLRISFPPQEESLASQRWSSQRLFYLLALILVLSVTFFGGYLLWRDVRREVKLAEMRSHFVSSVSHELKTPLTSIRMFAETLRLGRSKDKKVQSEYLDTIVNESERLTRLLNNVLDFSKIEKGKRIYRKDPAQLSEIIEASARAFEYPLNQQGFRLHVHVEEGLLEVRADRDALEQAVLNLLHNAMKYSGSSRDIDLRLTQKNGWAEIQVVDKGIGIDPKEHKKIFEKFYRISSPENLRTAGAGLGLALVSHIVNAHGGRLELESNLRKGSTFSILLPLETKP